MTTTFPVYPDLLGGTSETPETTLETKLRRKVRKVKKQCRRLKEFIEESKKAHAAELARIAEERRVAEEQRIAEEKKQEDDSFFSKVKNAIIKSIPTLLSAIAGFFLKKWFSSRDSSKEK